MTKLRMIHAEPPGADVTKALEDVAVKARNGEISSLAIAIVYRDGAVNSYVSSAPSIPLLLGSVARMQARLLEVMG